MEYHLPYGALPKSGLGGKGHGQHYHEICFPKKKKACVDYNCDRWRGMDSDRPVVRIT